MGSIVLIGIAKSISGRHRGATDRRRSPQFDIRLGVDFEGQLFSIRGMTRKTRFSKLRALVLMLTITAPIWIAGCLKVDAKFDRNGGGTMKLQISDLDPAGHARMQKQLVSPAVKLVSADYKDNVGTYEVSFEDAKKLRTAPLFTQLRIQRSDLDGARRSLSMTLPRREDSKDNKQKKQEDYVAIDLTVTVPGAITETNGTKVSESQSNWQIHIKDMIGTGRIGARTVYDTTAGAGSADAAPADAAPTPAKAAAAAK